MWKITNWTATKSQVKIVFNQKTQDTWGIIDGFLMDEPPASGWPKWKSNWIWSILRIRSIHTPFKRHSRSFWAGKKVRPELFINYLGPILRCNKIEPVYMYESIYIYIYIYRFNISKYAVNYAPHFPTFLAFNFFLFYNKIIKHIKILMANFWITETKATTKIAK